MATAPVNPGGRANLLDPAGQLKLPDLYLAAPDKSFLYDGALSGVTDLTITRKFNDMDEISFTIPKYLNNQPNAPYDDIEELMLILAPGYGWYKLKSPITNDGINEVKTVSGYSLECELAEVYLVNLEVNSGDIDYDEYKTIKFYNPLDTEASLMNLVLDNVPQWSIGHIDLALQDKQRTFDVDEQDIYSFLTGDVSEAFGCIFQFDSFSRTVNAYEKDNYGRDTNIYVDHKNLAKEITVNVDESQIKTVCRVRGAEGVDIGEINPVGNNRIVNYNYYLPRMSEGLQEAMQSYQAVYEALQTPHQEVMTRIQALVDELEELRKRVPEKPNSTNWEEYGLDALQIQVDTCQGKENTLTMVGYGDVNDPKYNLYLENHNLLLTLQAQLKIRQAQADDVYTRYESARADRQKIIDQLKLDHFLTEEEWKELCTYNREFTYTNENFTLNDLDGDSDRFEIEQELLQAANEELEKASRPQYTISTTLLNLFSIPAFRDVAPDFEPGNFIYLEASKDFVSKLRLLEYSISFDSPEDISVTFSDAIRCHDLYSDFASIQAQASSTATSLNYSKSSWNKADKVSNLVYDTIKNGLDTAKTNILAGENEEQVFDRHGLTLRSWNEERQDYDPDQIKMIKNLICFTDDDWESVKMALGKVTIDNEPVYGVIADALIGRIFLTNTLRVENENSSVAIDKDGAMFKNCDITIRRGEHTIKLNPEEGITIARNNEVVFHINSNGDLVMKGTIHADAGYIGDTTLVDRRLIGGYINAETFYSSAYGYNDDSHKYETNYTQIQGGNVIIHGADNYLLNSGTFYSDTEEGETVPYDANVRILNGTILLKGRNGYIRGMVNGSGYYKIIGISEKSNIVIGHNKDIKHGYYMGETANTTGFLGPLNINMYARDLDIDANNSVKISAARGDSKLTINSNIDITSGNVSLKGNTLKIGNQEMATKDDISGLQSEIASLRALIGSMSRPTE
ncbi:phage tail protein [Anaerolentibacter hominis]|uniref:phage tail protein n=1 Tax=Anaerolentibacter hominis TaxID=3079009 RepID=UPI0031B826F3